MQKNNKKNLFRTDLRQPLIGCSIVGLVALLLTVGITFLVPHDLLPLYGIAVTGVYVIVVGIVLWEKPPRALCNT